MTREDILKPRRPFKSGAKVEADAAPVVPAETASFDSVAPRRTFGLRQTRPTMPLKQ